MPKFNKPRESVDRQRMDYRENWINVIYVSNRLKYHSVETATFNVTASVKQISTAKVERSELSKTSED